MKRVQTKRFVITFLVIATCCILLLSAFLSWREMRVNTIDLDDYEFADEDDVEYFLAMFKTETIADENVITINGWCFLKDINTNTIEIHVLLHNRDTDKTYILPTTVYENKAVTTYFHDGTNYDNSGFIVNMSYDDSDFPSGIYDVYLLYDAGTHSKPDESKEDTSSKSDKKDNDEKEEHKVYDGPVLIDLEKRIAV